ncbi:MAG: hypothetical protein E7058_04640 [Lentisphaerae bacterium]|nr:hypothetical protein [Lentisphaerota bacterium]
MMTLVSMLVLTGIHAAEIFVDPAGGKSFSGKFVAVPADVQCGKPSSVTVEYANKKLHITLVSRRFPGWRAESKGSADDDTAMFGAETAEVFLMPDNSPDYYQFALNPAGHLYSARRKDKSWNGRIDSAVKVLDDRWIAEFVIPLESIGAAEPREGTVWRANFAISIYDGSIRRQASWSKTASFHDVNGFGKIVFTGKKFTGIRSWNVDGNVLDVEFAVPEKSAAYCLISGVKYPASDGRVSVKLGGKEIGAKNFAVVDMQIADQEKVIFSERHLIAWKSCKALEIDRFYVTGERRFGFVQQLPAPVTLTVYQDGKVLAEVKNAPPADMLDIPHARNGKITVSAVSQQNGSFARRVLIVNSDGISAPPLPPGNISLNGKMIRKGGKAVFFIGTTGSTSWHLLNKNTFSLDLGTVGIVPGGLPLRQLPVHRLIRNPSVGYLWKNDWQQQLHRTVTRSEPDRLHRICYEVQMDTFVDRNGKTVRLDTADFVSMVYRTVKEKYPDRFFTQQCDRIEDIHRFADHCDVLEAASWHSSYAEHLMPYLQRDMAYVRKIAKNKPVIFWLGISVPHAESRCAGEIRAGVYSAVFNDMAGVIFHLAHGGIPAGKKRLWSLISGINREISQWYFTYADGEKLTGFIQYSSPQLLVKAWKYQDRIFVGAVNTSATGCNFEIRHRQGRISGMIDGYDAVIWQIVPDLSGNVVAKPLF